MHLQFLQFVAYLWVLNRLENIIPLQMDCSLSCVTFSIGFSSNIEKVLTNL
jgi:hypothetical protein